MKSKLPHGKSKLGPIFITICMESGGIVLLLRENKKPETLRATLEPLWKYANFHTCISHSLRHTLLQIFRTIYMESEGGSLTSKKKQGIGNVER